MKTTRIIIITGLFFLNAVLNTATPSYAFQNGVGMTKASCYPVGLCTAVAHSSTM